MKPGYGVSLRRGGICAVLGVAMALGLLAVDGVSAAPVGTRSGTARALQPAVRWRLPHVASGAGANTRLRTGSHARWRVLYSSSAPMSVYLLAVTALNPHNAWAVGYTQRDYAVALHWIRGRWRRIPIPGAYQFFPQYVAASSPRDVWVFGFRNTGTGEPWVAVRWDGHTWNQVPQPPVPGVPNEVGFLDLGPSNVWFPSQSSCSGTTCSTPVCRWNGQSWVVYNLNGNVTGLAASSPKNIWAVGFHLRGRNRYGPIAHPVAYRWNGAMWRTIGMPSHAITGSHNGGPVIDTSRPRAVWIGSQSDNPAGPALLMHWNGTRWRELQSLAAIGGTAVIDWPIGIWTSPWAYWTGHVWQIVDIPQWMNVVYYLARVPRSETMLAVGGTILRTHIRGEIFAYGPFG